MSARYTLHDDGERSPQTRHRALALGMLSIALISAAALLSTQSASDSPLAARLRELSAAHQAGLLTDEELASTKSHILREFVGISSSVGIAEEIVKAPLVHSSSRRRSFTHPAPTQSTPAADRMAMARAAGEAFDTLIWSDEFSGGAINMSTWRHEISMGGGGNWEFEMYINNRSNSFVRDGKLHLRPTLTQETLDIATASLDLWGGQPADTCTSNAFFGCQRDAANGLLNPVQSARLRTAESFAFQYGKLEVRAKLPRGDWLWPAIWLLPRDQQYGPWPASGEIDLVESRGNAAGYAAGGVDRVSSTLHFGPHWPEDGWARGAHAEATTATTGGASFADGFHTYGLVWTADGLTTYIDDPANVLLDVPVGPGGFWQRGRWNGTRYDRPWAGGGRDAPFDQHFFLVFNVAAGGTNGYFPDGLGGKPWADASPTAASDFWAARDEWLPTWGEGGTESAMVIDWVRVYQ